MLSLLNFQPVIFHLAENEFALKISETLRENCKQTVVTEGYAVVEVGNNFVIILFPHSFYCLFTNLSVVLILI